MTDESAKLLADAINRLAAAVEGANMRADGWQTSRTAVPGTSRGVGYYNILRTPCDESEVIHGPGGYGR